MASEHYREILETKRLEIVKGINLERTILFDYLRTNLVFDQQDCELIRAATTNDGRVGKLIDSLLTKGPKGYQCFLDVVQSENATLYESLTGEKASTRPNEQMRPYFNYKPGLEPSVDYQQRILQDLTDSLKRLREAWNANEELQKKLEDANNNLEFERARNKHLENRLTQEMEIDHSLEKNELLLFHEYDEMERGIADRDVYIIVLQMKLLTEKEEVEKLKKAMEELEHKNEKMARELKRVSMSYNQERCQSLKLSECIRIQGDEIQKIDELKKQLRESQYKNIIATEERDAKIQELLELTKWTEALKTRFDALEKEKQNSLQKTEVVSNNCVFLQETVRTLNQKLSSTSLELEETKKRNELMAKDCELYKTQRNCALDARREAVNSRDKVISEKDAIQTQYNDLLSKREQMNEERAHIIQSYDALHARYERTSEELTRIKTALNEKEMEVEDLIRKLKEANDKVLPKGAILSEHANRFPVKMESFSIEDKDYREILEAKRFSIIQHLQIDRTFVFDYLRHKGVLDAEDCELIQTERTTSLKIGKFVDILGRKGPQGYQYLLESLQLENPALYEKLTGEKADATTSPIMLKLRNSFIGVGGPLGNSELEILTRHLERTYGDLHEMSKRFEQVVQHKKDIEEQLETTTSDLEKSKEKVDFLKKKIDSQKITSTSENNNWPQCVQYIDNMRKEISNRDIYIIALQANLMSSREEIEGLKRKNDNYLVKNEELQKMVKEMNESYHKNKCESLRLSERIERQGNEIKKAEQTMRRYRECQFNNMRLREEKEHLQEELDELTKWTDALKTRYDIVEYEKKKTMSDHTVIMADFGSLQEELVKCREETNESQLLAADLKEHARHLEHDRQTYKRQRDGAFAARREALLDRDRAFIERDQAVRKYKELKASNHATIEEKIWQVKSYDEVVARCDVMEEELKQTKLQLRKSERELEELKVKCRIEDGIQSEDGEEKQNGEAKVPEIEIVDSDGDISEKISEEYISRSSPSPNSIVQSIKRRMAPPSPTIPGTDFPTFPGPHSSPFITSDSIFGNFSHPRFAKEGAPKESGLDRKGVSRVPIKFRHNDSKENLFPEETQNEVSSDAEVVSSQNSDENTQQAGLEQNAAEKQNSDGSGSSKVVLYL